ncbi:tRNA (adenosine(37)-N6)-dimethylallyltransferase MiaA [Bacillus sp. FJAT-50079]|uniref:tRNA (adenosine(37)-N6)-dimethylallyltransferase MiaA n=1 Tax=Bacillus sp. FJAT-50079 TaxID=2833577 RepID=UPI001BCA3BDF|nr:tRNA (adenosine(37)-N6)-dimethylallyltransferase MiaA [Bacillus sp. FJAT-50079]MBS4207514.1 tRNA (adenosine(37)-N6)-dimethylallyltransferase MiaA [Bacillus sp. FJAT-50079]
MKEKVIVIVGPTAVGKTKLSIDAAKAFDGEIISGDSMQIYKGMDIGTAKIKKSEMEGIPHHLIDIKEPEEAFSVAEFQSLVRKKITEIHGRGKMPIIVGGTGLYIQAVLYDYQFTDSEGDLEYRGKLEAQVEKGNGDQLYEQLKAIDPDSAAKIHPNNYRRVIRALEVYHSTGKTMSDAQVHQTSEMLYDAAIIALTMEREILYDRINKRVDIMLDEGLLQEVKRLYDAGIKNVQSVQAIGYKELYAYLDGEITFDEAIELLKKNSRNYAKRQLTWFRNKISASWFDMTKEREQLINIAEIIDFIAGKLQIKSNT